MKMILESEWVINFSGLSGDSKVHIVHISSVILVALVVSWNNKNCAHKQKTWDDKLSTQGTWFDSVN